MKIMNFGSLNLDYVYSVKDIVKPGETVVCERRAVFCGGKGLNQSVASAKAGARVFHAGLIGEDGIVLAQTLEENGVDASFVRIAGQPTGHAVIQVDQRGQNSIVVYGGENRAADEGFIAAAAGAIGAGDMVLTQNETALNGLALRLAKQRGAITAFNPSPIDGNLLDFPFEIVDYLILNETEGEALTDKTIPDEICDVLLQKFPASSVILTLGKEGAIFANGSERIFQAAFDVDAIDTTAAGDTFAGYFLGCLAQNLAAAECLKRASAAAALAVSRMGAANSIPSAGEVDDFLIKYPQSS